MKLIKFDPLAHPRNRMGLFIATLKDMAPGDTLRMPGGVTVRASEGKYRISSPLADVKATDLSNIERVAETALSRQARVPHPATMGGTEPMTYYAFRSDELKARATDPKWETVQPQELDDLLARPTHGNPTENYDRLDDLIQQTEQAVDEIHDRMGPMDRETGARDYYGGDEDKIGDLEDTLERARAAMKELEAQPEYERDRRTATHEQLGDADGEWWEANHADIPPLGTKARWNQEPENDSGAAWPVETGVVVGSEIDPDGSWYEVKNDAGKVRRIPVGDTDAELEFLGPWPAEDPYISMFRQSHRIGRLRQLDRAARKSG